TALTIRRDQNQGDFRIVSLLGDNARAQFVSLTLANGLGGSGGAIFNAGQRLLLPNCTVTGNTAGVQGGGIYNSSTLEIQDSVLSSNRATGAPGGAIANFGTLTITNSRITGNTASQQGG